MNNKVVFNEKNKGYQNLLQGIRLASIDYLNSIDLSSVESFSESEHYKRKMRRLIKNQKRSYWKYFNTVGKKIAILFIILALSFAMSLNIQAIRSPVFGFFENIFEKFSEIFIDNSKISEYPTTIEEIYTLTGLPEGFTETEHEVSAMIVKTTWQNKDEKIRLYQRLLSGKATLDTEYSDYQRVEYNGYEVLYVKKERATSVFWHNGRYRFSIDWYDTISIEKMLELTTKLKIKT